MFDIELFLNTFMALSTFFAACAAYFAGKSAAQNVKFSKDTLRHNVMMDIENIYSSQEFFKYNRLLWHWYKSDEKYFTENYREYLEKSGDHKRSDCSELISLENARRKVKSYYFRIYRLKEEGILSKKQIKNYVPIQKAECFLCIILPMEIELHKWMNAKIPDFDQAAYNFFSDIYPELSLIIDHKKNM